jgi:hypothetical protein
MNTFLARILFATMLASCASRSCWIAKNPPPIWVAAYQPQYTPPSRRHVLQSIAKLGAATAILRPLPSLGAPDAEDNRKAQAEAEQKQREAEKAARRLAEETKKRLAVGRIGTI